MIIAGTVDNKFQLEDAEYINPGMVDFYFSSPSTHVITKMKLDGMPFNVNIKMARLKTMKCSGVWATPGQTSSSSAFPP